MHSSVTHSTKPAVIGSEAHSTPSSPSISLADFDYNSDSSVEEPKVTRKEPRTRSSLTAQTLASQDPVIISSAHVDVATKDDVASLRQLVQQEFEQLKLHKSPPQFNIPKEAFTDALRAEMAVQLAKISALEEENRKLRAEKQELRAALDKAEDQPGLQLELNAANQELQRVYVERQGLWDERADLWKERGSLWEERADLWRERQSLWDERDILRKERDISWAVHDGLVEKN